MHRHGDLTGLIKFLARDDWKSSFEEVLGEHFGPAMQEFDLEYEAIGAALGGGWDMTLWGVAFEDFLGRQFEPDGRNFVDEYLRRRGWNESAPTKAYMRGLRNSIMSLYEAGVQSLRSRQSAPSVNKPLITDDTLREMAPLFTSTWLLDVLPKALGLSRPTLHNSDGDEVVFHEVRFPFSSK